MECLRCVLESSVAVENRMGIRICTHSSIKSIKNQFIIVTVAYHIGNQSAVTQIQNGTQVKFMYMIKSDPIFEFRNICNPFLI